MTVATLTTRFRFSFFSVAYHYMKRNKKFENASVH